MMEPALIKLTQGKFAIVDHAKLKVLQKFKWQAVQSKRNWYAKAYIRKNGKLIKISMHRFIARTPFGMVCHHKDLNSLNNRLENLQNVTKAWHTAFHKENRILIKFEKDCYGKKLSELY